MIGNKLAHYQITSHLGTGGMGEVYQATDSKLGRDVAIKLLPEAFSRDADREARFEREARVLASLNHPRIAAIYGIEESGTRKFLVMELVAGETLADRIARGRLPLDEVLKIAGQIAEALQAAHESNVIHRDLKPANIKITPNGQVKVLDFGLAKAFDGDASNTNLMNSPTLTAAPTNAGVILGTAAYMSPEQAKGLAVDRRTDIFAFGLVLYEMLTGYQMFSGDTMAEVLAGVLKTEADWSRLPPETPASVRKLLRRCLQKDRNRRMESASDIRIEIEEAASPEPDSLMSQVVPPQGRRSRIAWVAAVVSFVVALAALALPYLRTAPEPSVMRLNVVTPASTDPTSLALSPDGRTLAFVASGDGEPRLWLRPLDSETAQPLSGTEGASFPFWSPNNQAIAFFSGNQLKRIDVAGGRPQTLANIGGPRGGTWGANGVLLVGDALGASVG
jgi:eukaryotic-like serine/threonine-protein kinase